MTEIILIRHAQASFASEEYDQLSGLGHQQAQALGRWLQQTDVDGCWWHGSMLRHRQTLTACLPENRTAAANELSGLNEFDHEDIIRVHQPDLADHARLSHWLRQQKEPGRAFQKLFVAACEKWITLHDHASYRESFAMFQSRVQTAIDTIKQHPAERQIMVSSGGVISLLIQQALGLDASRMLSLNWVLWNTSISRLRVRSNGHLQLVEFNSIPHLDQYPERNWKTYR